MKLVRFADSRIESYGILTKDQIICLPTLAKTLEHPFPSNIETAISQGIKERDAEHLIQKATKTSLEKATLPLNKIKLLAPLKRPPKIICLGLNYKDHAAEQGRTPSKVPVIFMKPHTAIIGPDENIVKPSFITQLDYEAELAIIIGRKAKNVSVEDAESCIFGYTILNDVSARDIQFRDTQWTRGKSFDTFAPTGPCIIMVDQVTDPASLRVCTWVNKELRQNSNTSNMVLNVFEIVHHLSFGMTLEPCDIIATGTPAGVGFAMKPDPKFLQEGDVVEIEIEGIGILRNYVIKERVKNVYG
jgi:2-keto-4-pentenoate hydratase/2-oxohepta-3-ene-1,7-dioic acid hydratase in catechol pathway